MSRENVEIVRSFTEAFQRRDREEMERSLGVFDPDVEWDTTGLADIVPDVAGVVHGPEGVRDFWRRWLGAWRDLRFEIQDVLDAGDEVVSLLVDQRMWGRHSGVEVAFPPYGWVYTFRGDRVVRVRLYPDHDAALEAAGLARPSPRAASGETTEVVRRGFEAFQAALAAGDPGAAFDSDLFAPDLEWRLPPHSPGFRDVYRGREGFMDFMRTWTEDFDWSIELESVIDAGDDRAVAVFRQRARGRASGVPVELRMACLYEVRDGRVIRIRNFVDPADALAAAELPG